jgi:TPR repeat protein
MQALGDIHYARKEYEQEVAWLTRGAEAGLPRAMYNLGLSLDQGQGVAGPFYPAAADWYRRAADAGFGLAAQNLSSMYQVGRGWAWQIMPATSSPLFWCLVPGFNRHPTTWRAVYAIPTF